MFVQSRGPRSSYLGLRHALYAAKYVFPVDGGGRLLLLPVDARPVDLYVLERAYLSSAARFRLLTKMFQTQRGIARNAQDRVVRGVMYR